MKNLTKTVGPLGIELQSNTTLPFQGKQSCFSRDQKLSVSVYGLVQLPIFILRDGENN